MNQYYLDTATEMLSGCLFIPEEHLTPDTQIIAIPGFDSISFETLLAQIEDFLDTDIDYKPFIDIKTIGDLALYLEKNHAR